MKQLKAEYLKTKGTATMWFTIGSALFLPVITFLMHLFKYKYFIPKEGINPWSNFFDTNFSLAATLFFPFYVVLSSALNLNIEHKSHSWKKLLILPVKRTSIFLHKGLFLLLQTLFAILLFLFSIICLGYLVGVIHPELKFLDYTPELGNFIWLLTRMLIASLGILSIQYFISVFFKNIIIPITIGVAGTIFTLIVTRIWKYAVYFPYSFSGIMYYSIHGKIQSSLHLGLTLSEWISIGLSLVVMLLGATIFKNKPVVSHKVCKF